MELVVARNPDTGSSLPFLIRVPVGAAGMVFRTKDTWPRTNAVFCYLVPSTDWPEAPDVVERVPLRACTRRGAAIDVVADRARENRSQIVFTRARGRQMVFWQSPRTRKQSRPDVSLPTARASGIADLEVVVDAHERYPYGFAHQQVTVVRRALPCGDYAVTAPGTADVVAAVERKSIADLTSSLTSGRLRYALGQLAALPRCAVVVEDRYSRVFAQEHVRGAVVADGLAELQVAFPSVPVVFCDNRKLAEEWTYRFLAAAAAWWRADHAVVELLGTDHHVVDSGPATVPSSAEVREWARSNGFEVSDRGRVAASLVRAWTSAHGG